MRSILKMVLAAILCMGLLVVMTGCENTTVMSCVLANEACSSMEAVDKAVQADALNADEAVYASVHFIESPLGMTYKARWSLDGTEVYAEEKSMETDRQGIIVFELPSELVRQGKLKLELLYKNRIAFDKELPIR